MKDAASEVRSPQIHRLSEWIVKTRSGDRDGGPLLVRRENRTTRGIVHPIVQSSGSQSATRSDPACPRDVRLDFCPVHSLFNRAGRHPTVAGAAEVGQQPPRDLMRWSIACSQTFEASVWP
jgi:hypothetical protein